MAFIFRQPPQDPNVHYHGKILPKDAAPAAVDNTDPTVNYNGKQLPRDQAIPALAPPDSTNNPSLVKIGPITLPGDVVIIIDGKKIIAQSKILDGVSVIEHVGRDPYIIEFEFTFRTTQDQGVSYVFPQDAIDDFWTNAWEPNSIQNLVNTYLNKLGISQIVVEKIHPITVRGSKNVPVKLTCIENIPGQSLIVTS